MPDEHDDWFDESAVACRTSGERLIEQFATAPSVAEGPLTRLWRDADDSRRSGADAVEALRERHRQAESLRGQTPPAGQVTAARRRDAPPAAGDGAEPDGHHPSTAGALVERCERCGRTADRVWTIRLGVHPDVEAERAVCTACHDEIRLFLLGLAATPAAGPSDELEPEEQRSRASRLAWFLLRSLVYTGIAVAIFVVGTWLMSR